MKTKKIDIIEAYEESKDNEYSVKASTICGCFNCLKIYKSEEIIHFNDNNAICPNCNHKTIIGDNSGYAIDEKFLNAMYRFWQKGE